VAGGRTVQRHVLHLGEINDNQRAAWCQTVEALEEGGQHASPDFATRPRFREFRSLAAPINP
jgi:hypothetical protein